MTETTMNALVAAGEELDFEIRAYVGYSGRSMYGKTTCAVVFESVGEFAAAAAQAAWNLHEDEDAVDALIRDLASARLDNMGRGHVAY